MPERSAEQIRQEIAAEREGLDRDLAALQGELRSLVPFVVALVTFRRSATTGLRTLWKLV